jgi:hypothetical protein
MLPRLKEGWIGVGIRPLLLTESELNNDGRSMGGRMKLLPKELMAGDSGGWLRTSASSSMSMSQSILLDSRDMLKKPSWMESGESNPPWSDSTGVMERTSVNNLGGDGVWKGRWGKLDCCWYWNWPLFVWCAKPGRDF